MAKYMPHPVPIPIRQDSCELVRVEWTHNALTAYFWISGSSGVKVTFNAYIRQYRVLEDMLRGTWIDSDREGVDAAGFAYTVENGDFPPSIDNAELLYKGELKQYAFISLSSCLDVMWDEPPSFEAAVVQSPYQGDHD